LAGEDRLAAKILMPQTFFLSIARANTDLGGRIDLVGFYESGRHAGGRVMYEPEQFHAVIYRMSEPKAVILIFASRKLVCTGIKKEREVNIAVNKVLRKLKEQGLIYK